MTLTKITLILLIIKAIYCENNVSDKLINIPVSKTTECLKAVIQKYFPCGHIVTLVIDSNKNDQLIKSLNSENECYSFIIRSYVNYDWFVHTPMYVIRASDMTEFSEGILSLVNDLFWNPRGRFIIELETLKEEEINTVFQILMDHKVYDAVLIRKSNDDFAIDTYYPFKDDNCGKKIEVATIGGCKDVALLEWNLNENISLRNCTVRVAAIQNIPNFIFETSLFGEDGKQLLGLERMVIETMAEKEGLQLSYMLLDRDQSRGVVLLNYTATGLLGMLQNNDVDIAAGGFILIKNRIVLFDFIWAYNYAAFQLFTPAAGEEIWKDVYKEFKSETWILVLIAYCLVALITTMRRRLLLMSQNQVALQLWGYFFLNTSSKLSKDKTFRMILVFWIWFTFFISNFYNTELYSLLTGRSRIVRDMNVDRLRELPFEPCISSATRTYYLFAFNHKLPEGRNIPQCKFPDSALEYVATKKNAYAIEMDYIYILNKYKYTNKDGIPQIDTWSFSINNIISMYISRGFPLRDKFQGYAFRLYETGILEKNLDEIYRIHNHKPTPLHQIHFGKILLSDLRIHFYIILLGYVLSILCFVSEILWYHYSKGVKAKRLFYYYYRADWNH